MGFVQVEIRRKRVDAGRIRKMCGYKNFPDTCGTGLSSKSVSNRGCEEQKVTSLTTG